MPSTDLRHPCGPIPGPGAPAVRRHASHDALLALRTLNLAWDHLATAALAAGTAGAS
jgi:hypothetical protein